MVALLLFVLQISSTLINEHSLLLPFKMEDTIFPLRHRGGHKGEVLQVSPRNPGFQFLRPETRKWPPTHDRALVNIIEVLILTLSVCEGPRLT